MTQGGELSPGDTFERYAIVRLLATGGMGEVYEATHTFTGRPVALKILPLRQIHKEDAIRRAKVEAMVLSRLDHPNVVKVHDADITASGAVWIAMELLAGKTLRQLAHASGAMPVAQALYYAQEIADGVAAAHEIGAIHRDLKPENVFITSQHQVKVLDLGTAKFYGSGYKSTDRHRSVGTPAYMAPEQILGEALDGRVDVYALGLMLYELIAGRHPLANQAGELPQSLEWGIAHVVREPPPLASIANGCPEYVADVAMRALHKKREERFSSMTELAGALRSVRERVVAEARAERPRGWTGWAGQPEAPSRPGAQRAYVPPHPVPGRTTAPIDPSLRVVGPAAVRIAELPEDANGPVAVRAAPSLLPSTQPARKIRKMIRTAPLDPALTTPKAMAAHPPASALSPPPLPGAGRRKLAVASTLKSDTGMPLPAGRRLRRILLLGVLFGLPLAIAGAFAYRAHARASRLSPLAPSASPSPTSRPIEPAGAVDASETPSAVAAGPSSATALPRAADPATMSPPASGAPSATPPSNAPEAP